MYDFCQVLIAQVPPSNEQTTMSSSQNSGYPIAAEVHIENVRQSGGRVCEDELKRIKQQQYPSCDNMCAHY